MIPPRGDQSKVKKMVGEITPYEVMREKAVEYSIKGRALPGSTTTGNTTLESAHTGKFAENGYLSGVLEEASSCAVDTIKENFIGRLIKESPMGTFLSI